MVVMELGLGRYFGRTCAGLKADSYLLVCFSQLAAVARCVCKVLAVFLWLAAVPFLNRH